MPTGSNKLLRVLLFDTKHNNPNHYIVLGIQQELQSNTYVELVESATYSSLIGKLQSGRFDVLIAVDGEAIAYDILARARPLVDRMVLWTFDDPYERDRTTPLAPLFDLVFTNDPGSAAAYPGGATFLPLAASRRFDYREVRARDSDYLYDVAFVGSAWPNRIVFLRRLLRALPDLKYRLVLQYNPFLPRTYLELPESSYIGSVSHRDFVDIGNASRVNITLHRNFSGDGKNAKALNPGPRLFELGLAGGFQLVDVSETPAADFYKEGSEIDTFETFEGCVQKLRARLAAPAERIAAATAAQRRTQREHTYEARVDEIISKVRALPRTAPTSTSASTKKPRLLFVTHNTIANGNFGGVEVYQETIANTLRSEFEIFYYRINPQSSRAGQREYVLTDDRHKVLRRYFTPEFPVFETLSEPATESTFARMLVEQQIELIHFHHIINHPLSLPLIAKAVGVPSVYTSQDFFLVCSRFNLLDDRGRYCDIVGRPIETCDVCLMAGEGRPEGAQEYRRSFTRKVVGSFDKIMGNSPSAMAILGGIYPELLERDVFVPLGLPLPNVTIGIPELARKRAKRKSDDPLRVVFLGNFTRIKGAPTFLHALRKLSDCNITFDICGRIDAEYKPVLDALNLPNVSVRGGFSPGELDLSQYDVSLQISNWPETYCITLSEAWKEGVVPIVTNVGALGDRVRHGENGFVIPIDGAGELVSILLQLERDREYLDEIRNGITPDLWLTPEQHCDVLRGVYRELLGARPFAAPLPAPRPMSSEPVTVDLCDVPLNALNWTDPAAVRGVGLPDPNARPLNPNWRQQQKLRSSIETGRVRLFPKLWSHVDGVFSDQGAIAMSDTPTALPPSAQTVFLEGWLRTERADSFSGLLVGLRGTGGDFIVRDAHLKLRPDVAAAFPGSDTIGFIMDPPPRSLLEPGVYAAEALFEREQSLEVAPLDAVFFVGANVSVSNGFTTWVGERVLIRVPYRMATTVGPEDRVGGVHWAIDEVDVQSVDDGFTRLMIRGWAKTDGGSPHNGEVLLSLVSETNGVYVAPLKTANRPDVADYFKTPALASAGYAGGCWITGLPAGVYELTLSTSVAQGISIYRLEGRRLIISEDGFHHLS